MKKQWIQLGAVLFLAGLLNGCSTFQKNQDVKPVEIVSAVKEVVYENLNSQWTVYITADYENYSRFEIKFENKETKEVQSYKIVGMEYKFLWNEDASMVAVSFATRKTNEYLVINLKEKKLEERYSIFLDSDFQEQLSSLDTNQILSEQPVSWEGSKLRVEFSYSELDGVEYDGSYQYDYEEKKLEYSYFDGPVSMEKELEKIPEELAGIKLKDLTATKIADLEALDKDKILLLAELPKEDIALYGLNNSWNKGVILRTGDQIQTFDWDYMTPQFVLPGMVLQDCDQDGKEELVINLTNMTGTEVSVGELHVLEQQADFSYKDYRFSHEDYMAQVEKLISYEYEEEKKQLRIFTEDGKKEEKLDLSEQLNGYTFTGLRYGDLVRYTLKDTIRMKMILGYGVEESAIPVYGEEECHLEAAVEYQDGTFTLQDLKVVITKAGSDSK